MAILGAWLDTEEVRVVLVDSPPPGVNMTDCVVNRETGHCCIDRHVWKKWHSRENPSKIVIDKP